MPLIIDMKTNQFKEKSTALSFFLQGVISLVIGIIMFKDYLYFLTRATTIICIYFWFVIGINGIQLCLNVKNNKKEVKQNLLRILGAGFLMLVLVSNTNQIYTLIPLGMMLWLLILSVSNFITFVQYYKEPGVTSLRYLFLAIIHLIFAIPFMQNLYDNISVSIQIMGVYLIILGCMLFLDGLSMAVPRQYKILYKQRVRITLPTLVATFLPMALLNRVNDYFSATDNSEEILDIKHDEREPNVEIFIHVSETFKVGHVDLSFDDKIVSYGCYDKDSIRCKGMLGDGVLYEVEDKVAYTTFCGTDRGEVIFGFGLALEPEMLHNLRAEYSRIKANTIPWLCKAQRAKERGEDTSVFMENPCRLSQAIETKYYKFAGGSYKHYWVLGTNCVRFIDELLRASGIKTIIAGIITPGTYYSFLNNEFLKGNSVVITKRIYGNTVMNEIKK